MFSIWQALATTRRLLRHVGRNKTDRTRGTTRRLLRHIHPYPIQWLTRPALRWKVQHQQNKIQLKVSTSNGWKWIFYTCVVTIKHYVIHMASFIISREYQFNLKARTNRHTLRRCRHTRRRHLHWGDTNHGRHSSCRLALDPGTACHRSPKGWPKRSSR